MSIQAFRFATVQGHQVEWFLRRNCSIAPGRLVWVYAAICLVSLGIGTCFWLLGATLILPFAWLEVSLLGVALWFYARHATDGERIFLLDRRLVVERETGGRLVRAEFNRDWVRVEPMAGNQSLILVSGQGRAVEVGRFVRPELRQALAQEIRMVLRSA